MLNEIMDVLTPKRMMTMGNLALQVELKPEELHPLLEELAAAGRIRYAQSKCSGVCSTCSTCTVSSSGEVLAPESLAVDPTAIVISMEIRKSADD